MKLTALTNKVQQGFTLVELLVVIGILGVLVAALLATLDPLEQIRKGNDSARLSVAREYQQAYSRYYAGKGDFPWNVTGSATGCDTTVIPGATGRALSGFACNNALVTIGELKSSTIPSNINNTANALQITSSATNVVVCFRPESKAQKQNANTAGLTITGATGCTGDMTTPCYVCVQ